MYSYKEWSKGNTVRFYISPAPVPSFVYVTSEGAVRVVSDDAALTKNVYAQLRDHLNITEGQLFSLDKVRKGLNRLSAFSGNKPSFSSENRHTKTVRAVFVDNPPSHSVAHNSLRHFASDIKMTAKTLKSVVGTIDTRESPETIAHYTAGAVRCQVNTLQVGDLQFSNEDDKVLLIIERKTLSDFYKSITSTRAHSQAERLYIHAETLRKQGWRVMVCWFVVGNPAQSLYDVLPETKQMDGMLNYLSAILGQYVFQVFNDQHGAYLANKLVQGFNELKLTYPVKNETGQRVDIPKKSMKIADAAAFSEHGCVMSHNVNSAKANQLLYTLTSFSSINMKVAKSLASTGMSLREIMAMTESELVKIDGVGKILAKKIVEEFAI